MFVMVKVPDAPHGHHAVFSHPIIFSLVMGNGGTEGGLFHARQPCDAIEETGQHRQDGVAPESELLRQPLGNPFKAEGATR